MRSDPKGFNRGSELPVILAFSPKIKVDTHLDNRTHISTDRIYVAYLVGPHKHNRKHTFAIQSNAQANEKFFFFKSEPSLPLCMTKTTAHISLIVSTPHFSLCLVFFGQQR